MSQTTHTPGPWRIDHDSRMSSGQYRREYRITAPTPKPDRRYTVTVLVKHCEDAADAAITAADARLIAAAPDLLAALRSAESMLRTALEYNLDFPAKEKAEIIENHTGLSQIRQTILKATQGA